MPHSGDRPLGARELATTPLVVSPPGTSTRILLEQALTAVGVTPQIAVETAAREAIVPLVLAGAGAALLPAPLAREAQRRGATVRSARAEDHACRRARPPGLAVVADGGRLPRARERPATAGQLRRLSSQMLRSSPVDGFQLSYELAGSGDGVVLIHGWPGDHLDYRHVTELLADCTVVVPDLRGFGRVGQAPEAARGGVLSRRAGAEHRRAHRRA